MKRAMNLRKSEQVMEPRQATHSQALLTRALAFSNCYDDTQARRISSCFYNFRSIAEFDRCNIESNTNTSLGTDSPVTVRSATFEVVDNSIKESAVPVDSDTDLTSLNDMERQRVLLEREVSSSRRRSKLKYTSQLKEKMTIKIEPNVAVDIKEIIGTVVDPLLGASFYHVGTY